MFNKNKILLVGVLTILIMSSISTSFLVSAKKNDPGVNDREGSTFIETDFLSMKLHEGKPDMMFWLVNSSEGKKMPVFHVSFTHIAELFGDDLLVHNMGELSGEAFNLASSSFDWTLTKETLTNEVRGTITSDILENGATISFVFHVYLEDILITEEINETNTIITTTYQIKSVSEIKFDIIVDNWTFSPEATGLVFAVKIHELAYKHRVQASDGVNVTEDGYEKPANATKNENKHGIEFYDESDGRSSYFTWVPTAQVYDTEDSIVSEVNVTSSMNNDGFDEDFGKGKKFGRDFINLFLSYPNYGDGLKMVHDPTIGIDQGLNPVVIVVAVAAGITLVALVAVVVKRR